MFNYLRLSNRFSRVSNKLDVFEYLKDKIDFKISLTKLIWENVSKNDMISQVENIKKIHKEYGEHLYNYLNEVFNSEISGYYIYAKVEEVNTEKLTSILSEYFNVDLVAGKDVEQIENLFLCEINAFSYFHSNFIYKKSMYWWEL